MIRSLLLLMALAGTLLFAQSCTKDEREPCLQPRTTVLRAQTIHPADTGTARPDTVLPNPQLRPLTGLAQQYIFSGKRLSNFTFTLSNVADSSRWILRPDSALALEDTLTFYYQRQLRFLSNACGYTNFYNLDRVATTRHVIDSVFIMRADITTDANVLNLRLLFY